MNGVIFTDLYFILRIVEILGLSDFLKVLINVIYSLCELLKGELIYLLTHFMWGMHCLLSKG